VTASEAISIAEQFCAPGDGAAMKSRDLILDLLRLTSAPFSRAQFTPGHITCTALVLHPSEPRVLMMHHHRLHRWLLPGGHVEEADASLAAAAWREAVEETCVTLEPAHQPVLAGMDVHGIPPKRDEPFHLHHDLIWSFRALSDRIETTGEAPEVCWAAPADWDRLAVAPNIRLAIQRVTGTRITGDQ
jgi:8-oxo-dGTP pyrophosphatase MutT (NUDIX family)